MNESRRLLIIGTVWPEPGSSAAGQRMIRLINLFKSAGWEIIFVSSAKPGTHGVDLSAVRIETAEIEINSSSFDKFVRELQPNMILFDRFPVEEQFGWRVAEQCPDAIRVLDTEDLHCLRRSRGKAVQKDRKFEPGDLLREESAKREIASILRCDLTLIISEYEMELLDTLFEINNSLLCYLPFMLDTVDDKEAEKWPSFEDRAGFMTIGNFQHAPNWDAVQYLRNEIWPLIRQQLPSAELYVYGAYPSEEARSLHQPDEGFYIKGRAEDAGSVMRSARVCLAPLRFGAGLKGKLAEAMLCGTPSVTTTVGAEGMAGDLNWNGILADQPEEIATAAVTLYTDKQRWQQAQQQGRVIINNRFDGQSYKQKFLERIEELQNNLQEHRAQNFYGAMLMHHTAASTKYMSRWIEAKNKLVG